jgi:hypothetical protein
MGVIETCGAALAVGGNYFVLGLSKRAKKLVVTFGVLAVVLAAACWVADNVPPSAVRQALPATATDVQEYYQDDAWQGDFVRCLEAKMPQSELPQLAAKLGLVKRYNPSRDQALLVGFAIADAPSWWHPPTTLAGAYFNYKPGKEAYSIATYQNGRVYFLATAW